MSRRGNEFTAGMSLNILLHLMRDPLAAGDLVCEVPSIPLHGMTFAIVLS